METAPEGEEAAGDGRRGGRRNPEMPRYRVHAEWNC